MEIRHLPCDRKTAEYFFNNRRIGLVFFESRVKLSPTSGSNCHRQITSGSQAQVLPRGMD